MSKAHGGKASGSGGSDLARHQQFVFLNGRPVDLPRVNKALNDSYRCGACLVRPMLCSFELTTTYI